MATFTNKHGVECVTGYTGIAFGCWYIISPKSGKRILLTMDCPPEYWDLPSEWVTNAPFEVPVICLNCQRYDRGEYGDYNELLAGPLCRANVRFPIRKGSCRRRRA